MGLPSGSELARRLLGRVPDTVQPLVDLGDHAAFRVSLGAEAFVCKADDGGTRLNREAEGQQRAFDAGVPVPQVVAVADAAFAMRFVDGVSLATVRDEDAWRSAGRVLRRVHALAADGVWGDGLGVPAPTWRAHVELEVDDGLAACTREFGFDAEPAARIRAAVAVAPVLDAPIAAWCHGDCQPDHFIIDPGTHEVAGLIDWSDHGKADAAWDHAVLTLDDAWAVAAVLDGYAPDDRAHFEAAIHLLRVSRWLGEALWLRDHGFPHEDALKRAIEWTP